MGNRGSETEHSFLGVLSLRGKNKKPLHRLVALTGAPFQLCLELTKGFVAFLLLAFQEPQSLANDFARGLVTAGLDAALQETIEFRSHRDVDSGSVSRHIR